MVALGQTITVVNKSGKVVSTSKHLVNVFKGAQSAYRERKAELKVARETAAERKQGEPGMSASKSGPRQPSSRPASQYSSRQSSPGHHRSGSSSPRHLKPYTDSLYANDSTRPVNRTQTMPSSPQGGDHSGKDSKLTRRRSDPDGMALQVAHRRSTSSLNDPNIDMDLAYGEFPPPLPARHGDEELELVTKMSSLQQMLEELNCLQYSVKAMIKNLEKNPEAMAAVALTLAEISNLASKMAPGALTAMKGSFPAVIALLASPEFAIAIGVGVGITVVALGGYKIIKRIKAKKDASGVDELEDVGSDMSRIEAWRRGLPDADADAASVGTSVEGEFITPSASQRLIEEGVIAAPKDKKAKKKEEKERKQDEKDRKKRDKSTNSEKGSVTSAGASVDGKKMTKEPSGLKMLFKKEKLVA